MSQVEGSGCRCGRQVSPPRRYCPDCQRGMSPVRFEGQGVVEAHTSEEVTADGFEAPVHIAIVRLAEGAKGKPPVRVLTRTKAPIPQGKAVTLEVRGEVLWAEAR